jgi:prepilin signal peptidase PulO-like enzyme (type II secretory pathway)
MFEIITFLIALVGTLIASYYDLRTTEIPDLLPILMIILGISINLLSFFFTKDFSNFIISSINGVILAIIGFSMYFGGQWGAGDAFLLTAIGFLIPKKFIQEGFPFVFDYLTNLFFLGSIYMIIYSIFFSLKDRKAIKMFKGQIRKFSLVFIILFFSFFIVSILISKALFNEINFKLSILTPTITCILLLIWLFSKNVEKSFIRRVEVSKLKVGDVLLESKRWDGISEKEIEKIRKSGKKYVYVKSGVCFAPAFPIALIFTLFFGNSLILFLNFLSLI